MRRAPWRRSPCDGVASNNVDGDPMSTLSEMIAALQAEGYTGNWFATDDGLLRCSESGLDADPATVTIDRRLRFEGQSDPDDEVILFALSEPGGRKGVFSTQYGPTMPTGDALVIAKLNRSRLAPARCFDRGRPPDSAGRSSPQRATSPSRADRPDERATRRVRGARTGDLAAGLDG